MELTITYNIEVTEIIKEPDVIENIMADRLENIAARQDQALRDGQVLLGEDLHVYDLKLFYNEEPAT